MCSFGAKCYRKNPAHFLELDHPIEHPLICAEIGNNPAAASSSDVAPVQVPPQKRARNEAVPAAASSGWLDDDDDDAFAAYDLDAATAPGTAGKVTPPASCPSARRPDASPSVARASAPPPPPTSSVVGGANGDSASAARSPPLAPYTTESQRGAWAAQLKETFLTPFRDDLFELYAVARREQPAAPLAAFASAGVTLLAPFKLLAGEVAPHDTSCLDDRGVHDPPEFQPLVLVTEGAHGAAALGYWRDDPTDAPAALVVRRANPPKAGPGVTILALDETHLVHALAELVRKAGTSAPLRAQACARVADALSRVAAADGLPPSSHASGVKAGSAAAARKKASIGPTSNRMGIIVPYDRQSEVGYRTLSHTGKELRTLLDRLDKASAGSARSSAQAELDELVHWANIANDECDFGASLQLGQDLFNHSPSYAPLAARTLATAYTLLDRGAFATIAEAHARVRQSQVGAGPSS